MPIPEAVAMTRRCFFGAAGLAVAATGAGGAQEASVDSSALPKAVLLNDGDAKTYLLVFHTGARSNLTEANHGT